MAKKPNISNVASGYQSTTTINNNFENIRNAFDNTLSRDGSTPNSMLADLDMNGNAILNVGVNSNNPNSILTVGTADARYVNTAGDTMSGNLTVPSIYATNFYLNGNPILPTSIAYNGVVKETKIATSGQTVFNLSTISYTPGINNLSIYVDGIYQKPSNYTENSGTQVTFSTGLHVGAVVDFVVLTINSLSGTADAVNLTYTAPGVGAVNRTIYSRLSDRVSVKDFGAVGDGIADDTAAFNAAFTYMGAYGAVYAPKGTYRTTAAINVTCSFYGDGEGTIIRPSGQHEALTIRTGKSGQPQAGFVRDFTIDFSGVSPRTSACVGMWLSKGSTPAASSGCNNVLFSNIFIFQSYRGIQMLNTDLGNLWNTKFQNILIYDFNDYGIYIDTTGNNGSLNVSFDTVTCDAGTSLTAKGAYISGINNCKYFGTATAFTGGVLSAFNMANCSNVDVRLQIEGITVSSNLTFGLVGFLNCASVELSLRSQTCTFNPGAGNQASYVYLDGNVRNFVLRAFEPIGDVYTSGTIYKINCFQGQVTNTRLSLLDQRIAPTDVLANATVIADTLWPTTNYALQKTATTRRLQALDVTVPNATATNLVSVADYAGRPYQVAALYLVQGSFSGNNTIGFTDLVLVTGVGQSVAQTVVAVSSNSINGGHARTYGIAGGFLQVTLSPGSGSYIISATGFDQAGSAN